MQQKQPPVQRPKQKPGRIPEREVLFSGQAFDINPTRQVQPVTRPDVFDLTVSVKQNFGGNQNQGKCVHMPLYIIV